MREADSTSSPRGELTVFEKRLCNALQNGLPLVERPFAQIAKFLKSDEKTILKHTRNLLKQGVIRRIGVVINWRAIGKTSTLVTAHIEKENLPKVVKAVNALKGVSHNYLRNHHFNLWFTLRADSLKQVDAILKRLSKRFGVSFFSLPVTRAFKLDVRFDAQSGGRRLLPQNLEFRIENEELMDPLLKAKQADTRGHPPKTCEFRQGKRGLSWVDERILQKLQEGIKVVKRPFAVFKDSFENFDCLLHIEEMIHSGVILRIGAIVNQRKLGFAANAMFVCKAQANRVVKVGEGLARLGNVSHCYERKPIGPFDKLRAGKTHGEPVACWPYNLFGMMHGRTLADIRRGIDKFVKAQGIKKWELLETVERLKK